MLIAGWKTISLVDVHGKVTFTLWLCGCNLKCPFCHNWKIADRLDCQRLDKEKLLEDLEASKFLIDYFHVTGGEPLLQWRSLRKLFSEVKGMADISLNTNCTLKKPLERLISDGLIDHIATDLKAPPQELYGLPPHASERLWNLFLESLEMISNYGIPLELRIPVPRNITGVERYIEQAIKRLRYDDFYVVVNPLLGFPLTSPRSVEWSRKHCNPSKEEIRRISEFVKSFGVMVFVKSYPSMNRKIYK